MATTDYLKVTFTPADDYDEIIDQGPPDLFGESASPPYSEPTTSLEAAKAAVPLVKTQRKLVLSFIRYQHSYGATDSEVQEALNMSGDAQRPRRWQLEKDGLVIRTKNTRKTPKGRNASVFVATEDYDALIH